MADNTQLVDWALANSSKISLKVTKLDWISDWLPGHFDYQIAITCNAVIYRGRGIDPEEPVAFAKAVAEAFERFAMTGYENPWATAAYIDYDGAATRAYYELVGIDRALCHHYCKERFSPLDLSVLPGYFDLKQIKKALKKNGLEARLYELRPVMDARTCTMMAWHKDTGHKVQGFVNGYGCAQSIAKAAASAAYECLRTAAAVYLGGAKPERPLGELNQPGSAWYHFWATQTKECMDYFSNNLQPPPHPAVPQPPENLSIKDVTIQRISTLSREFPDIPLFIAQAKSDKFIKPQFGPFRPDGATLNRLKEFCGHAVEPDLQVPHFYG